MIIAIMMLGIVMVLSTYSMCVIAKQSDSQMDQLLSLEQPNSVENEK